ncbi:MAG: helix-turn-helix domain-containing protein [Bacteroidota bacterium]|nr:helix-turn-helix domain-containing protein [Bacteroidota bacterium]
MSDIIDISSVSQIHELIGLGGPSHPLVSFFHHKDLLSDDQLINRSFRLNLFDIMFKDSVEGSLGYGRNSYDFSEGSLVFIRPGQVIHFGDDHPSQSNESWSLIFHPDLIRRSPLARSIEDYGFFSYEVHEALHVSEKERDSLFGLIQKIRDEYERPIDAHSQKLIVNNIELFLDYCLRYYDRQFLTRTNLLKDQVGEFNDLLRSYFRSDRVQNLGLPTVKYLAEEMNMSPKYLSDLLKKETGMGAQEHIHSFMIDLAKTRLLGTAEPVSQIAYDLGFEYPQHFSKLFKNKTGHSPADYRRVQ